MTRQHAHRPGVGPRFWVGVSWAFALEFVVFVLLAGLWIWGLPLIAGAMSEVAP